MASELQRRRSCRTRALLLDAAVLVICRAGAFRRHHQCANRMLRRAGGAEHLALPWLDDALQHLAALAGFRVGDPGVRHRELPLRVERGVLLPYPDAGMVDRTEAAPFKEFAQLVYFRDRPQRRGIARVRNDAGVLVLDLAAAFGELLQHHPDRLQDVERLEAGDDERPVVVLPRTGSAPRRRPSRRAPARETLRCACPGCR